MIEEMFYRLIISIGSLFFLILLILSYISKKFNLKFRNKLYVRFMMISFSVITTEIITYMYFSYGNSQLIYTILSKIQCIAVFSWGWILLCYFYASIYEVEQSSLKDYILQHKIIKYFTIISILFFVVICFIPAPSISERVITFMPNYAIPCIIHYNIAAIIVFILGIINFKKATIKDRVILFILVFEVPVFAGLQNILPPVAFLSLCNCLQTFIIYFYYENPDLFMIEEIETLTKNVEKLSSIKSEFISNVSHEIRSPLNAIMGFSESLLNDNRFDKEKVINDITTIKESSKTLLEIINNILDISNIESNQESLVEKDYSFKKLTDELISIVNIKIEKKPIKLIIKMDENIPDRLYGDSSKIYQILLNVLSNAVKYTEVGKVMLSINKEINKENILLKIKISDTGYGIKTEDCPKIFEKFTRLDEATNNEIEGTGLGLAISKKYVELMNGKIWFESVYGVGTDFYIEIPQVISTNQNIEINDESKIISERIKSTDLSKYKALIVDNNSLNMKVASRIISKYGIQVETIDSGKECIYKFKGENHYDIIFMDHMMPEMSGIDTLHVIRKLEGYYQPPIVVLTANAVTGAREMYLKEGFDDYLKKPLETEELERVIDKFLITKEK